MKKAPALLVIALAATAWAEPYRPLPRLPPAKVQSRAAQGTNRVPVPPAVSPGEAAAGEPLASPEGGAPFAAPSAGDPLQSGSVAGRVGTEAEPVARAARVRRARRVGPPPPLQDEVGRVIVFASVPPLQDEAGGMLEDPGPLRVIVLPSRGSKADDVEPRTRDRSRSSGRGEAGRRGAAARWP